MLIKENTGTEKEKAEHNKDLHLWKAESVCEQMKTDKKDFSMDCISFSLQQILQTPHLNTNVVFYCRQLWTYNLQILDSSGSYMALQSEEEAACGSS